MHCERVCVSIIGTRLLIPREFCHLSSLTSIWIHWHVFSVKVKGKMAPMSY